MPSGMNVKEGQSWWMECCQHCTCTQEISPWSIHQTTVQFKAKACLQSKEQHCVNRGWDLVTESSQGCRHLQLGGPEPKQMGVQTGQRGCRMEFPPLMLVPAPWSPLIQAHLDHRSSICTVTQMFSEYLWFIRY